MEAVAKRATVKTITTHYIAAAFIESTVPKDMEFVRQTGSTGNYRRKKIVFLAVLSG